MKIVSSILVLSVFLGWSTNSFANQVNVKNGTWRAVYKFSDEPAPHYFEFYVKSCANGTVNAMIGIADQHVNKSPYISEQILPHEITQQPQLRGSTVSNVRMLYDFDIVQVSDSTMDGQVSARVGDFESKPGHFQNIEFRDANADAKLDAEVCR